MGVGHRLGSSSICADSSSKFILILSIAIGEPTDRLVVRAHYRYVFTEIGIQWGGNCYDRECTDLNKISKVFGGTCAMHDRLEAEGRVLISTNFVRDRYGVMHKTLKRWVKNNMIRPRKLSRMNFYDQEEIERVLVRGE
jgi:hypothetical protein